MKVVQLPGEIAAASDRWTAGRKQELLRRLDTGEIGLNEAIQRFSLTLEEIEEWRAADPVFRRRALRLGKGGQAAQGRLL